MLMFDCRVDEIVKMHNAEQSACYGGLLKRLLNKLRIGFPEIGINLVIIVAMQFNGSK